jgi:hypothetical protein
MEPPDDSPREQCAIRGCGAVALWICHNAHDRIDLCTRHRDLIEDEGLDLG